MYNIIVTDGLWRKSLSAIRSLGRKNCFIHVLGDSFFTTGFWSRYTSKRHKVPNAKDSVLEFGKKLLEILRNSKFDTRPILFPMEDATLLWLSEHRNEVSNYADFLIPSPDSIDVAESKAKTMKLAAALGLPMPATFEFIDYDDFNLKLNEFIKNGVQHKYIVKPTHGSGSLGIVYLNKDVLNDWRLHWDKFGPLMLQERLDPRGKGIGVSLLMDMDGHCVASFVHERIKQYPNSGGPSTQRISISNPKLVDLSIKLLQALNWRGVAMVEWKGDLETGSLKLMEINPRFWGSLELAVRSGVDFPWLYAECSAGKQVEPVHSYKLGQTCRWLIPGDILRYLSAPSNEREKLKYFLNGLPQDTEEWDSRDIKGTISAVVCPAMAVLNPKYWKYLIR